MYYHASPVGGLRVLKPHISNHGVPLVYASTKRENVLVYLSNAVEKYARENGFAWDGVWEKWGPYGFEPDGRLRLEEYYPDALADTYRGVSGYIYRAEHLEDSGFSLSIPDAAASSRPVGVTGAEFVPDAYEAILQAEREGKITVLRYEALGEPMLMWLRSNIREEYAAAEQHPEYRHFLRGKFPALLP